MKQRLFVLGLIVLVVSLLSLSLSSIASAALKPDKQVEKYLTAYQKRDYTTVMELTYEYQQALQKHKEGIKKEFAAIEARNPKLIWERLKDELKRNKEIEWEVYHESNFTNRYWGSGTFDDFDENWRKFSSAGGFPSPAYYLVQPNRWRVIETRDEKFQYNGQLFAAHSVYVAINYLEDVEAPVVGGRLVREAIVKLIVDAKTGYIAGFMGVPEGLTYRDSAPLRIVNVRWGAVKNDGANPKYYGGIAIQTVGGERWNLSASIKCGDTSIEHLQSISTPDVAKVNSLDGTLRIAFNVENYAGHIRPGDQCSVEVVDAKGRKDNITFTLPDYSSTGRHGESMNSYCGVAEPWFRYRMGAPDERNGFMYSSIKDCGWMNKLNNATALTVKGLSGITSVQTEWNTAVAFKKDGTVWAWGISVGDKMFRGSVKPVQVERLSDVVKVELMPGSTFAFRKDGTVWTWGTDRIRGAGDILTPVQVPELTGVTSIKASQMSIAIKKDGSVWAWGCNITCQSGLVMCGLGDGKANACESFPVRVKGVSDITAVDTEGGTGVALKKDGTVWAWGANESGQIGDGTTQNRSTPVQVIGISEVTSITSGYGYVIALKNDGTVWAWGANELGQIGDGTTQNRSTPVQVQGLSEIITVESMGRTGVALKRDGTVWTWGFNESGQLGDGTTQNRSTPELVQGLSGVTALAVGGNHIAALRNDGTVWAWGSNEVGQLGDGTTQNKSTPVQVEWVSGIIAIEAGVQHTVAIKKDGTVLQWPNLLDALVRTH